MEPLPRSNYERSYRLPHSGETELPVRARTARLDLTKLTAAEGFIKIVNFVTT